jgi:hypothetical protein
MFEWLLLILMLWKLKIGLSVHGLLMTLTSLWTFYVIPTHLFETSTICTFQHFQVSFFNFTKNIITAFGQFWNLWHTQKINFTETVAILICDNQTSWNSQQTNSMAHSPQANYTNWATATCWRNLVLTFVDRGVSCGQCGRSPTIVNLSFSRPEPLLFFQVASHLSSQGLSGPCSRPTATQKIWWRWESNPGPLG